MPGPYKYPYEARFKKLSDPNLPYEEKVQLTREFATKYPKAFNKQLDKIAPDPYRGTRKMASMLIQQYPDRFPGATPDQVVDMMQKIAMVESKDKNIAQMKGGPGRGYFQIETTTAPTALKRYQNYQDILAPLSAVPLPKFKPTPSKPVMVDGKQVPTASVMNLSKDQQAMLALSNITAHAKDKGIVDVANPMDTWATHHWAGSPEQRPERIKHWEDTFRTSKGKGGRLTKEGKKIRKYGPRPDYMNQNPSGMTTGPITQRSIGNTSGGGYMQFADGGWVYPTNTGFPKFAKGGWTGYPDHTMYSSAMGQFDRVRDYTKYADGGVTFDTGVQASDNTRTAVPQQAVNIIQAKQFQSDLKNPRVTEEQFKTKHGISREQYRNRPSNFDVAMNQVWQGAKEPFKFIGADPDLIRENSAVGVPQALSGVLIGELPIQEMGRAAYNVGNNALKAGKILAEEGVAQLGNYGYHAPRNLINDIRKYSKGVKNLQDDLMYFNSNTINLSPERYKELENIRRASNHWKNTDVDEATRITKLLNSGLSEEQIAGIANAHPSYLEMRLERLKTPEELNPPVPEGYVSGSYRGPEINTGPSIEEIRNQYGYLLDNPPPLVEIDPRVFNLERPVRRSRRSRTLIPNNNLSFMERLAANENPETRFISEKSMGDIMSKFDNKNVRLDFRRPRSIKGSFYRSSNKEVTEELNQLQRAINESKKGEAIHGAYSVSDSSYPLFLSKLAQNTKSGKVIPTFSGEYQTLNEAGHLFRAGIPKEDIAGYINKHISDLEKISGKRLPKAEVVDDEIMYPAFGAIKQKLGGQVTWQIID